MNMTADHIRDIVLGAIRNANLARTADKQLEVGPDAPIFGKDSPLDSLGLVALLIDVEECLADHGAEVSLSDSRAMSQSHSPFKSVATLVAYIESVLNQTA